jgi:alcohol dehydrogenase (cytochrome c)
MRSACLALLLGATTSVLALAQTADDLKNDANTPGDVLVYGMGYAGQRYSPLTRINKQNVGRMVPIWSYSLSDIQSAESFP